MSDAPPKLSMNDILAMFELFSFTRSYVNDALAKARDKDDAFDIFEGLKTQLQARWLNLQSDLKSERIKQLRPAFERLQKIKLKNYKPPRGRRAREVARDVMGTVNEVMGIAKEVTEAERKRRVDRFSRAYDDTKD